MSRILYLKASPRIQSSSSRASGTFLSQLSANARTQVEEVDLWRADLPRMAEDVIDAKYASLAGVSHNDSQATTWRTVRQRVTQLSSCDRLVISTPMWNFGIPYVLKHWIDVVTQPRLTFSFSPETGYSPLLTDRPALVVLSSAGDYRHGPSWGRPDLATPYLRAALAFIGIRDLTFVRVGPTVGAADIVAEGAARADQSLRELALRWSEDIKEYAL